MDNVIHGNNCNITGSNNHIVGDNITLSGSNSTIINSSNTIVSGSNITVIGVPSGGTITGSNTTVFSSIQVLSSITFNNIIITGGTLVNFWSAGTGNGSTIRDLKGFGTNSLGIGLNAYAEGNGCTASGVSSHAEGFQTIANGAYSHAQGDLTQANGDYSHAEGAATIANGLASHAQGFGTKANGALSHAYGMGSVASGIASTCVGYGGNFVTGSTKSINPGEIAFGGPWNAQQQAGWIQMSMSSGATANGELWIYYNDTNNTLTSRFNTITNVLYYFRAMGMVVDQATNATKTFSEDFVGKNIAGTLSLSGLGAGNQFTVVYADANASVTNAIMSVSNVGSNLVVNGGSAVGARIHWSLKLEYVCC